MLLFSIVLSLLGCRQETWPDAPLDEPCKAGAIGAEERVHRVNVGGRTRQALFWAPPQAGPHDVWVNLHEYRSEPRRQNHYSGVLPHARAQNALLIGPDGLSATWNAGDCCGRARQRGHPDVAFLDEVVQAADEVACTSGRVLAMGIGNGAMMAHRWACESDVPDAVISVGGALQAEACAHERPIPLLHYHGQDDTWMPADGSAGHRPLDHAIARWVERNQATEVEPLEAGDLTCRRFTGKAPLMFCSVAGMEDVWPGAADGQVQSEHPLAQATEGGIAWVEEAWEALQAVQAEHEAEAAAPQEQAVPPALEAGVEAEER